MRFVIRFFLSVSLCLFGAMLACLAADDGLPATTQSSRLQKRWFFEWRNMNDPKEVDRMIGRFPRAKAAGYNGAVFSHNVPSSKAAELKEAAREQGLDLIAIVMGNPKERN